MAEEDDITEGAVALTAKESISVCARWYAVFIRPLLRSRREFLPSVVQRHACGGRSEVENLIFGLEPQKLYLIFNYESVPNVFIAHQILGPPSCSMDLAISDVAFTWSIIYHHEDGFFSKGPFLLLNQETANPHSDC